MKRYFLVPPGMLPHEVEKMPHVGDYHYIDLDSHGAAGQGYRVLVMMDERKTPHPDWQPLPHLLDAQTTLAALPAIAPSAVAAVDGAPAPALKSVAPTDLLADVGADAMHTGYSLAKQLAAIHPAFEP